MGTATVMQVNLGRGLIASQECLREALQNKFSVLLLQEPFVGNRGTAKMGTHKVVQSYRGTKPVKSAIVILNDQLVLSEYPRVCNENVTCVAINLGRYKLGLVSVYLEGSEDIGPYLQQIQEAVEEMNTPHVILAGDVNAKSHWWGEFREDDRGTSFVELLAQLNMTVLNSGQTATFSVFRNNRVYESIVDVTACTNTLLNRVTNWKVHTDLIATSDHRAITFEISTETQGGIVHRQTTRRYNTKKADWQVFDELLEHKLEAENITTGRVNQISTSIELNQLVAEFTACITQSCEKAIPAVSDTKNKKLQWWTEDLIKQKAEVVRRRSRIRGANPRRKKFLVEEYLKALQDYKDAVIETRLASWKDYCTGQKKETMWQRVYKALIATTRHSDTLMSGPTGCFMDPRQSAKLIADTFYPNDDPQDDDSEQAELRARTHHSISTLRSQNSQEPLTYTPFVDQELKQIVKKMGPDKAPGDDGFTALICSRVIIRSGGLFLAIMNKCLELGYFPVEWKTAVIRVIPKPLKEDYSVPKSYRPIGLLPVFGKILEKLFTVRLMWHLGSKGMISERQYGFMPQRSTEDALFDAVHIIREAVSDKKIVAVLSLDIEGAFDGAWWPGILDGLIRKSCPSELLLLINSYLSERAVKVQYAGQQIHKPTTKGCIQGSTCGPLMWNIVLDPLLEAAEKLEAHVQAFADDILVIASATTTAHLNDIVNNALKVIAKWGQDARMKFAAHKTQAIITTRKKNLDSPQFWMSGVRIPISERLKVLGLTLDHKMTFLPHIDNTCNRAIGIYKAVSTATRANWGLNPEITRLLYTAVVEPIVLYAASVWAHTTDRKYISKRLNQLTRRFGILIARTHRTASHSSVLCLAGILPLDLRVKEAADLFLLKRGKPFAELPGREIEERLSPFALPHPAKRKAWTHEQLNSQEDVDKIDNTHPNIYTDGSKIEGKVAAAVTWWENGVETDKCTITLAPYCSVYQAELAALLKAVEIFGKKRNRQAVNIISDSRSSLDSLADPENVNPIVSEIQKKLMHLEEQGRTIRLFWIRAHAGIPGNERADELAKGAALRKKTSPTYDKIPVSYLKYSLRQSTIQTWNARYLESATGKITKLFFPDIRKAYAALRKIRLTNLHALLFTGHGGLREYLFRFKLFSTPSCICDSVTPETVTHVLEECPRFDVQRLELTYKLKNSLTLNYHELVMDNDDRDIFLKFAEQVVRAAARANGSTAV